MFRMDTCSSIVPAAPPRSTEVCIVTVLWGVAVLLSDERVERSQKGKCFNQAFSRRVWSDRVSPLACPLLRWTSLHLTHQRKRLGCPIGLLQRLQSVTCVLEVEHETRGSACCLSPQFLISVPDGRLLIVLIQRLEECHQGGKVVGLQRDTSKLDISVT